MEKVDEQIIEQSIGTVSRAGSEQVWRRRERSSRDTNKDLAVEQIIEHVMS
jgi:hypothetical protein